MLRHWNAFRMVSSDEESAAGVWALAVSGRRPALQPADSARTPAHTQNGRKKIRFINGESSTRAGGC